MMDGAQNKEKKGVRVDIGKALLLFRDNINDYCSVFHQKFIQNAMLLERVFHLERSTRVTAESEAVNSYNNTHF